MPSPVNARDSGLHRKGGHRGCKGLKPNSTHGAGCGKLYCFNNPRFCAPVLVEPLTRELNLER